MAEMTAATPIAAQPPVAAKKPHSISHHGVTITDDYAWLRDPGYPEVKDPEILAHLEAENAWFQAHMAPRQPLIDQLFAEMRGRIKEADKSVPQKDGNWVYWIEYEEGAEYKKWWRRPIDAADDGSADELLLDEVALAQGHDYFRLGAISVSNDGRLLAWSVDDNGSERFTAQIKVIASGEILPDEIPGTNSGLIWVKGDTGLVYSLANENWRTDNVRLHWLGQPLDQDVELYHEDDEGFRAGAALSANEKWLIVSTGDHETSEVRLIPADDPLQAPILVRPREKGVEYDVDLHGEMLFVHTNDTHENFRLATAPLADPADWTTLIAGSDDFYLTGFELFRDFYVVEGRVRGLDRIEVRYYDDPARIEPIAFPEASYEASLGDNPEWATQTLRVGYESMVSPSSVFDYDVPSRTLTRLKVQEIPSGYDASRYETARLDIPARDGTLVPVSVVWRKDRPAGGPLHLYGYGAYGIAIGPGFSTTRLSLLDRGMAYAIAHIRGGDDLGRGWYKAGKLDARTNTFNDFIDVARGLIDHGFTTAGRISASGGSAGGELMGAVINQAPDLFGAVVADVPFVDVLATMLDESLPLTPGEWPEWGNPIDDAAAFHLIRSYSPYDQVKPQAYPPLMVTAGLNDPRVTYWEPAKWVARLRELKTDSNPLIFKTNMGAGHGGKSGRFESLKEAAEEFAFLLTELGIEG
ncbi:MULTISPECIES: S9 family peptidase [unclassified Novosphingobium]|uniref:S9 family peptidase n=1 Tax=unclassified Novosphingobium TaxID=2644732 RepID=UPI000D2FD748|nr:oligopeptidase B [Novosphingobium sp. GV055]PUB02585.1 oligopeptidase B [Novosphingobium sp. GV061]PUB19530.1 oligopeptidase B [Novosphingobium sp. GV079]PUB40954.1 oligopeptidase B [Novosphingobium sp. GV027]